jgi:hypothetical protein
MSKYKLNWQRDVDTDEPDVFILNLPAGFRLYDEMCHVRGFDTRKELTDFVKWGVVPCDCAECNRYLSRA